MEILPDYYENEYAQFWIKDGILFFKYKQSIVIDLSIAHQIVADRVQMQNEKSYPILCDIRGLVDSDKAARDYLAQSGSVLAKAVGIVTNQSVSVIMTSFYLKISKPSVPTKIFTDEPSALAFLETYK
jgi:hypothetical protein